MLFLSEELEKVLQIARHKLVIQTLNASLRAPKVLRSNLNVIITLFCDI